MLQSGWLHGLLASFLGTAVTLSLRATELIEDPWHNVLLLLDNTQFASPLSFWTVLISGLSMVLGLCLSSLLPFKTQMCLGNSWRLGWIWRKNCRKKWLWFYHPDYHMWFMWNWFWLQNLVWFLHPLGSDDYCIQFYSNVIPFEEQWCFCFFQVFQCWVSLVTMINMISAPKLDHFLMLPLGDWPVRCYLDAACIHLGQGELFERGIYSIAGSFSVAEEMRVLYSETPGTDWWAD